MSKFTTLSYYKRKISGGLNTIKTKNANKYNQFKFRLYSSKNTKYNIKFNTLNELKNAYHNLNDQYHYFHHYFHHLAPNWLRDHRKYFSKDNRAFGEDAFLSMWYYVFSEFKPQSILEIGVYRGATLSLFSLLSKQQGLNAEVHGISPFSSAGDSVSVYLKNLDYHQDVLNNFEYFKLQKPFLHKGYSTDIEMIDVIKSKKWDLIFIDGCHDYEIAKKDFELCSQYVKTGGLIVFDDASLYTEYNPKFFSFKGHPGPSKVVSEIPIDSFIEVISCGHNRVFKKI
ncbi:MAG: class I SAM-dependent methyltransferase [Candidatus Delongbacteria bacterium]|nr:class I SAM-dependent methyltransferase [Candidatus Delongbacteria bacterium]